MKSGTADKCWRKSDKFGKIENHWKTDKPILHNPYYREKISIHF